MGGKNVALVEEECHAARNGVVIFDQSYFGKFFLQGPEAMKAADWLCTAKMDDSRPMGSVAYTALCNQRGGVEADLTVTKLAEDSFYIAAGGSTFTHDWRWISTELEKSGYKATLRDASDEYCMISVQGPYSRKLLAGLVDIPLENEAFGFSTCQHAKLKGHELMIFRLTFIGELGFELHVPSNSAVEVYKEIMAAGEALSATGVKVANAGYRAIDSMSAEKGYRHWHADLSNRDTPLHGQETIWRDGQCVGFVKSAAYGFSSKKQIAFGYVDAPEGNPMKPKAFTEWMKAGSWHICDKGEQRPSTLHLKSVFDPKGLRASGEYPPEVLA